MSSWSQIRSRDFCCCLESDTGLGIIFCLESEPESDDFAGVGAGVERVPGVGVGVGRKKPDSAALVAIDLHYFTLYSPGLGLTGQIYTKNNTHTTHTFS